jgi:hypothetical protein
MPKNPPETPELPEEHVRNAELFASLGIPYCTECHEGQRTGFNNEIICPISKEGCKGAVSNS